MPHVTWPPGPGLGPGSVFSARDVSIECHENPEGQVSLKGCLNSDESEIHANLCKFLAQTPAKVTFVR